MKKTIYYSLLSFFFLSLPIAITQADDLTIDRSCLEFSSIVKWIEEWKTIKVKTNFFNLFPIQNGKLLNYKLFEYWQKKYIDYKIIWRNNDNISAINDWDIISYYSFNQYEKTKKEIILEFSNMLSSDTFFNEFIYSLWTDAQYFVSKDNNNYIKVWEFDLHNFDFKYLKIVFNTSNKRLEQINVKIHEISFYTKDLDTYLINAISKDDINILTHYNCKKDNAYNKFLNKYLAKNINAKYSIDIDTKEFELSFARNELYVEDIDNDGINNNIDNCPFDSNNKQKDSDWDFIGDICDYDNDSKNPYERDYDNDWIWDNSDNCKYVFNAKQKDSNANWIWDLCSDDDNDWIISKPFLFSPS